MRRVALTLCVTILAGCSMAGPSTSTLPMTGAQSARAATKSTFKTLFIFQQNHLGIIPVGTLLVIGKGLYGTTNFGGTPEKECYPGNGCGVVYDLSSSGKETVVYRFTGPQGGARPYDGLIEVGGTLYGTTQIGGSKNDGSVFGITPSGKENVIYSFHGKDGNDPRTSVTNVSGVLYGVTYYGGDAGIGTLFSVTTSGTEKVLHSFTGGSDGSLPLGALLDVSGVLYGTTSSGGASNAGTVFSIDSDGSKYKVLYSFKGKGGDGAFPFAGLMESNGKLYGTTQKGGKNGEGTVYTITSSGSESPIYSFGGGKGDGEQPFSGLTSFKGSLYGTTSAGGANRDGTIFSITTSGSETVLHSFTGPGGGRVPYANLTPMGDALYGTTVWGGRKGAGVGTAYEFVP